MKRNSLFTKLLAMMLCVMMVVGCLPLSALADANDWESEIDPADPIPGSEEKPFEAALGDNTAAPDADDYNWVYTAEYTGTLVITSAADFTVNDTEYALAEDAEEVSAELAVTAADEVKIYSESFNLAYKPGSCPEYPIFLGSMENAVTNAGTVYYMGNFSGTTMTVTGEGDFTVTYNGEEIAAVDGVVSIPVSSPNPRMPVEFSVTGDGEYTINFAYPAGTTQNPAIAVLGDNTASVEAGNTQGFYMTYTADYTGTLLVELSGVDDWTYTINNMTTYVYGDAQYSDSDPVVNPAEIAVTAGDEIQIIVNTYDAADMWNTPAGEINVNLAYKPGSCPEQAIFLPEMENDVTNAGTVYYMGYFSGTTMTVAGAGDFSVIYNGETIAAVDGVVSIPVSSPNPRMPVEFSVTGDGDYTINFVYPAGTMENPATAVLGDNAASIAAGTQGYYWNYTAEKDGELNVTISGADQWTYVVNNKTQGTYGDTQYSDSDPVVNPTTIAVTAGDVIEIVVNGYDSENPWEAPAANLTINLAYTPEGPEVDPNLKLGGIALAFADYISVQPYLLKADMSAYESYYLELTYSEYGVDPVTEVMELFGTTSKNLVYELMVLPRSMTAEIALTVYAVKDGVTYRSETVITSVETLANDMIVKFYQENKLSRCKILVDMLNYGAAVQTRYVAANTDLPTVVEGYEHLGTADTPVLEDNTAMTGDGFEAYRIALGLGSKVEFQFAFTASDLNENYELRYEIDGGETGTIPYSEFVASGKRLVAIFALKPRHFRSELTVAMYDKTTNEPVSVVYTTTVEDKAATLLGGTNEAVAIAMMKYGDAVIAHYAS